MNESMVFLGYLIYRRKHDDFLLKYEHKVDFTRSAWVAEPWRARLFTEDRARYVAKILRAEICPIYDRGDKHIVFFDEETTGSWEDEDITEDMVA